MIVQVPISPCRGNHEAAENDRDESEGTRERSRERGLEIRGSAFPGRLRHHRDGEQEHGAADGCQLLARGHWLHVPRGYGDRLGHDTLLSLLCVATRNSVMAPLGASPPRRAEQSI